MTLLLPSSSKAHRFPSPRLSPKPRLKAVPFLELGRKELIRIVDLGLVLEGPNPQYGLYWGELLDVSRGCGLRGIVDMGSSTQALLVKSNGFSSKFRFSAHITHYYT